MPMYDFRCACGHEWEQLTSIGVIPTHCGQAVEKTWKTQPNVISDVLSTKTANGMWIENLGHTPIYVETKSELKRLAHERGRTWDVRHVPGSKYTQNWDTLSKETLAGAKDLLEAHSLRNHRSLGEGNTPFTWKTRTRSPHDPWPDRFEDGQIFHGAH